MVGPQRKQRKPTIPKRSGVDFKSVTELKSEEENNQRRSKVPKYVPKKKVILLPGPAPQENEVKVKEDEAAFAVSQFQAHYNSGMDENILEFIKLAYLEPRPKLEYAYLFSEAKDSEGSDFIAAKELNTLGLAKTFLIPNSGAWAGYTGFNNWKQIIESMAQGKVSGIAVAKQNFHTLMEANALVSFAKENGISNIYIVAPIFHLPRAFLTTISAVLNSSSSLNVFAYAGKVSDWEEEIVHSQGILRAKRIELFMHELQRIDNYQKKGDLVSAREAIDYTKIRDRRIN